RIGEQGGGVGGGFEQHCGIAADDLHIGGFIGAGVTHLGQLQHLALGDHVGGAGQYPHDAHVVEFDHQLERARIEEVTNQYTGCIAPQRVGGGAAAAQIGGVDHV